MDQRSPGAGGADTHRGFRWLGLVVFSPGKFRRPPSRVREKLRQLWNSVRDMYIELYEKLSRLLCNQNGAFIVYFKVD